MAIPSFPAGGLKTGRIFHSLKCTFHFKPFFSIKEEIFEKNF